MYVHNIIHLSLSLYIYIYIYIYIHIYVHIHYVCLQGRLHAEARQLQGDEDRGDEAKRHVV